MFKFTCFLFICKLFIIIKSSFKNGQLKYDTLFFFLFCFLIIFSWFEGSSSTNATTTSHSSIEIRFAARERRSRPSQLSPRLLWAWALRWEPVPRWILLLLSREFIYFKCENKIKSKVLINRKKKLINIWRDVSLLKIASLIVCLPVRCSLKYRRRSASSGPASRQRTCRKPNRAQRSHSASLQKKGLINKYIIIFVYSYQLIGRAHRCCDKRSDRQSTNEPEQIIINDN